MDENNDSSPGGTRAEMTKAVGLMASAIVVLLVAGLLFIVTVAIRRHAPLAVRVAFEVLVGTAGMWWILRRMWRQHDKRPPQSSDRD